MGTAVLSLAAACGSPSGGLSEQQAVSKATTPAQQMSSTPVAFVSAASGHLGDFDSGVRYPSPNTEVWAVTFSGTFPPVGCGPATLPGQPAHGCPAANTSTRVYLNYTSGALLLESTPATG
jgi:hypothetical protein